MQNLILITTASFTFFSMMPLLLRKKKFTKPKQNFTWKSFLRAPLFPSNFTFRCSSTGLTKSPRPRKSFNHPSTHSWTLDEADLSSSDGLNKTWEPVSSKRIVSIGRTSESCKVNRDVRNKRESHLKSTNSSLSCFLRISSKLCYPLKS